MRIFYPTLRVLMCIALSAWAFGGYAALSGTYTINRLLPASATNYVSISAAISDMVSGTRPDGGPVNGPSVSGPVVLRIASGSGPYNEQVIIGSIPGASATRTVRITGGPTRETVAFAGTTTTERAVFKLNGSRHVTLDSLTITNNDATYGYGVWITAGADSNQVLNSNVTVSNTATTTSFAGITISGGTVATSGDWGDYNLIQGNHVVGGYYGITARGSSTTVFAQGNRFIDNIVEDVYYYGLYCYQQNLAELIGNTVSYRATGTTTGYAIYNYYSDRFRIERNKIYNASQYLIYCYYANNQGGAPTSRATIANNMLIGGYLSTTPYGMYITTNSRNIDIFHNSVSLVAGNGRAIYILSGSGNDVLNNSLGVFNSTTGYALYVSSTSYITTVNNNNYWAPGSSNFVYLGTAYTPATFVGGGGYNADSYNGNPYYKDNSADLHGFGPTLFDVGANGLAATDFDGEARPMAPTSTSDIGADEYNPDSVNVAIHEILEPTEFLCPDSFQTVRVVVFNLGSNPATNVPVGLQMTGPGSATLAGTLAGPINFGEYDTLTLGTVNTYPGGGFNFKAYVGYSGDQDATNDTLNVAISISPVPNAPTGQGVSVCAGDSAVLRVDSTGNTHFWFNAPQGGTQVNTGDMYNAGILGASTTYWVEARGLASTSLPTLFAGGNGCEGNMFDLTAFNTVTIDSFDVNIDITSSIGVELYYKTGTYAGFETTAGAWTLVGTTTVIGAGAGNPTRVPMGGLTVPAGQTYAIYIRLTASNIDYTNGTNAYTNADMSLQMGAGLCSQFGGVNPGRMWNGRLYYRSLGCPSARTPIAATLVPSPVVNLSDTSACGSVTLDAGAGASGYQWSTSDSSQTIVATTSGMYSVVVTHQGCSASDTALVTLFPNPTVSLGPDQSICAGASAVLDAGNAGSTYQWSNSASTQIISVNTAGTYSVVVTDANGCSGTDTAVVSLIPSPTASFNFTVGGGGLAVSFTDLSTGNPSVWSWDFGDSGTSTAQNPSHTYTGTGTYTVTLIVTGTCGTDTFTQTISLVGIENGLHAGVGISPNPTRDVVTLSFTSTTAEMAEVLVTDVQGKAVLNQLWNAQAGDNRIDLDLSHLSSGMYFVRVQTARQAWTGKAVKE